jgi:hypothetical protein
MSSGMIQGRRMAILPLLAILLAGGCAQSRVVLPWGRPDPDLASAAADTAAFYPDTSAVVDTRYEPDHAVEITTLVEAAPARREAVAAPVTATPRAPMDTVATPAPTPIPPPTISVAIPEEQRVRLAAAYKIDVAAADSLRGELTPRVTSVPGKEKLQTVADLIIQARAAMNAQNVEAAANLAHKARLLVEELLPR